MKIIVVGAGASGIVAAINLKRKNPTDDILVIEHLDKPLKKILSTGNGKCNLGNKNLDLARFNHPDFVKEIVKNYSYESFFDSIYIKTKTMNDLVYPMSESAISVRNALLQECDKLQIKINSNEELIDYSCGEKIQVTTSVNTYKADKLILAGALKSSPKLGSDGSILNILKRHNYEIIEPKPGLAPIYTKEKTKRLDGIRVKSNVKLHVNNRIVHEEKGEVLFKEHGLSGIVIFNTLSIISRYETGNFTITLDLLPEYTISELREYVELNSIEKFMSAFLNPNLSIYLQERFSSENEIINAVKALNFSFDKAYGFEFSQVSVGGVSINQVDQNLMSKKENNVYIIGELLDIDGPCGGYNLTWAFASALYL